MSPVQLRVQTADRARLPGDGSVESLLTVSVARSLEAHGRLGTALVVVRPAVVELVTVIAGGPIRTLELAAGLTTTVTAAGPAEAVGLLGRVERGARAGTKPVAVVFLEWPDCRWWMWECQLAEGGANLLLPTVRERAAIAGDPLPGGIGRFWTHGRRLRQAVKLSPIPPTEGEPSAVN